jgi:hypothetical protein
MGRVGRAKYTLMSHMHHVGIDKGRIPDEGG